MGKSGNEVDWCEAQDWVEDQRIYRCSACNKRLYPREVGLGRFQLPRHKKKGWKIKRAKARKLCG